MTEDEARKLKDPGKIPWDEPCFVHVPGRYYLAMCFLVMPESNVFPKGGDITAEMWRFDQSPGEWILTYRFRYYRSGKIWNSGDRKHWWSAKFQGDETAAENKFKEFADMISGASGLFLLATPPEAHWLWVRGDCQKMFETMQKEKPFWMHIKVEHAN